MKRVPVDLSSHLNQTVQRGHPADFPVVLRPVFEGADGILHEIPHRRAVVREDTGDTVAVVSDRYTLVPHQQILDTIEESLVDLRPATRPGVTGSLVLDGRVTEILDLDTICAGLTAMPVVTAPQHALVEVAA